MANTREVVDKRAMRAVKAFGVNILLERACFYVGISYKYD